MAADVPSLLASSQCYNNYGPGSWPLIEIELLKSWLLSLDAGANTDPAYLLSQARCYNNYSAQAWLLKLGLWQNIVGSSVATDPQSLLNSSACYNNYGPGMWPLIYLGLLTQNATGATDVPTLMSKAACDNNYSAQSWLIKLELLKQISQAVNPTAATDPASILASANCYNNYGPGLWPLFELALVFYSKNITPMNCIFTTTPAGNEQLIGLSMSGSTPLITGLTWNGESNLGGFYFQDINLVSASFPNLTNIDPTNVFSGGLAFYSANLLSSVYAPLLSVVGAGVSIDASNALGSLSLPALTSIISSGIQITNCPELTVINLPSASSIGGNWNVSLNTSLVNIFIPNVMFSDGSTLTFDGNSLNAATVNLILARCVASGLTSSTISISSGTSAAPTGQGLIDKAALILAGCTVTTN